MTSYLSLELIAVMVERNTAAVRVAVLELALVDVLVRVSHLALAVRLEGERREE
jgi:hypothetical protein